MTKKYFYLGIAAVLVVSAVVLGGLAPLRTLIPDVQATQVVELKDGDTYDMTASFVTKEINGTPYKMLAYNGSIPGPLIKVAQGAEVTINFKNDTGMPTLFHSHGVRMDNAYDGSQSTQPEMQPGETFSYKLKFPDAGVYWYHPHVREDLQQELGLYGNYLVVPGANDYWNKVSREVTLFLDDILIENEKINLSTQAADRTLMGRFGNVMLVNGETNYTLDVKKGEVLRLYVTNAANTRTFNFAIKGARMKLVGGDGGATEREEWRDSVILGPSERAVVEVLFEKEGTYTLEHRTPDKTYTLGTVNVSNEVAEPSYAAGFAALRTNGAAVASIDPFRQYFDKPLDKRISLTVDMMGNMMSSAGGHQMPDGTEMPGMGGMGTMMGEVPEGGIEWEEGDMAMMNQMSTKDMTNWKIVDRDTGKENMDIGWTLKRGVPVKIRITNDANSAHPMQHPIHFHGQRFLVLNRNGVQNDNLVWKDTVLVPAGQYVDILLDPSNPGLWMAHCHIAEHLEAGMMFTFKVE